jgi:hypothetical protein
MRQIRMQAYRRATAWLLLLSSASLADHSTAENPADGNHSVEVQMQNVMYHFTDNIVVHIRRLHGELIPTKGDLPVFDDKESFTLKIASAEIAISSASLANVLNSYVFAKPDAPVKGISIHIESGDRIKIKGKLHRKGDIAFETEGRLSTTPDGKIRLHAEKVKALHLPVKGLMDLLGIEISDLIKTGKVHGVTAEKDDLILDPQTLLPPPHIAGQVSSVHLERDNLVQVFGTSSKSMSIQFAPTNYMYYRGNQLRFGKLTMTDTDMALIDMDPGDPFDFDLDHYKQQLVAGYTKETPSFGLRVFMRDFNKIARTKAVSTSKSQTTR